MRVLEFHLACCVGSRAVRMFHLALWRDDRTVVRSVFHFVNIGVAVMMAASAAFGLIDFRNFENVVLSVYLM